MKQQTGIALIFVSLILLSGYTNAQGILDAVVTKSPTTFEARNTDDIRCGYRTAKAGEQINFICPNSPKLRVDVDNNYGYALANVAIAIDGKFAGSTNAFGYTVISIPNGSHKTQIFYQMDENRPFFMQEQQLNITSAFTIQKWVADETKGIQVGSLGELDSNVSAQCGPLCLLGGAAILAGLLITYQGTQNLCNCIANGLDDVNFSQSDCVTLLFDSCGHDIIACGRHMRDTNFEIAACWPQYGSAALDYGTMGTGGLLIKTGKAKPILKLFGGIKELSFVKKLKILETVTEWKVLGERLYDYTRGKFYNLYESTGGKAYNYIVKEYPETGEVITQIKTFTGKIFADDVSLAIETTARNPKIGKPAADETVRILDTFGEYTDDIAAKRGGSLTFATKEESAQWWSGIEKKGLHAYIGETPEAQGHAILSAMEKSGDFENGFVKRALELDEGGQLKNIKFEELIGNGPKNADNYIKVGERKYWIDSTGIEGKLTDDQHLYSKIIDGGERQYKFQDLASADGIQVIELENGTTLSKIQIESTLQEILAQNVPGTAKLKVYDRATGNVFWWPHR